MPASPDTRLGDKVRGSRKYAARQPAQSLVERDIDRVKGRGELRVAAPIEGRRLPDPGAVQMNRRAAVAGPPELCDKIVPSRQLTADLALGQLDQQRPDPCLHTLQIGEGEQPVAPAHQLGLETVEVCIGCVLVQFEVAGRVKRDRVQPTPVTVDSQRDLLSHRPARHQHSRGLFQDAGDADLKGLDELARSVVVRPFIRTERVGRRPQKVRCRCARPGPEPPLASPHDLAPVAFYH